MKKEHCPISYLQWKPVSVATCCYCCSVTKSCPTPCNPMDCSMPCFPVLHYLLKFAQIHVPWVDDAIQPYHPLSPSSPPTLSLSQHQGLLQWVGSSHQVAKVLQLQHQSFQWIFRTDFLKDWLARSPCYPRDSQESSPAPVWRHQFFSAQPPSRQLTYWKPHLTSWETLFPSLQSSWSVLLTQRLLPQQMW